MNFFKRIWRKMLGIKTGAYTNEEIVERIEHAVANKDKLRLIGSRPAYDPSTDEQKILLGEVESYFD